MPEQSYVVTLYIDAPSREMVDQIMSAAHLAGASVGVNVKNWMVDDDETPELHQ